MALEFAPRCCFREMDPFKPVREALDFGALGQKVRRFAPNSEQ